LDSFFPFLSRFYFLLYLFFHTSTSLNSSSASCAPSKPSSPRLYQVRFPFRNLHPWYFFFLFPVFKIGIWCSICGSQPRLIFYAFSAHICYWVALYFSIFLFAVLQKFSWYNSVCYGKMRFLLLKRHIRLWSAVLMSGHEEIMGFCFFVCAKLVGFVDLYVKNGGFRFFGCLYGETRISVFWNEWGAALILCLDRTVVCYWTCCDVYDVKLIYF